jgi:hypothetical protein
MTRALSAAPLALFAFAAALALAAMTGRPALVANSALNVVIALVFPTVAVPNPKSASGANDRLNKVLPALYRRGAPGYRIVYQNDTWRLYGRMPNVARQKDY